VQSESTMPVWMMTHAPNWDPRLFVGEFKPDGDNTAHMQMQKALPDGHRSHVLCAGSIQNGQLKWNSMYNNDNFRATLNIARHVAQIPQSGRSAFESDPDYARVAAAAERRNRRELKAKTPDTPCKQEHRNMVQSHFQAKAWTTVHMRDMDEPNFSQPDAEKITAQQRRAARMCGLGFSPTPAQARAAEKKMGWA